MSRRAGSLYWHMMKVLVQKGKCCTSWTSVIWLPGEHRLEAFPCGRAGKSREVQQQRSPPQMLQPWSAHWNTKVPDNSRHRGWLETRLIPLQTLLSDQLREQKSKHLNLQLFPSACFDLSISNFKQILSLNMLPSPYRMNQHKNGKWMTSKWVLFY